MNVLNLENKLRNFMYTISQRHFDYLYVIARKGIGLLRLAYEEESTIWQKVILSNRRYFFPLEQLGGKSVIIIDDALATGEQIREHRGILMRASDELKPNIKVAVFIVQKDVPDDVVLHYYEPSLFRLSLHDYMQAMTRLQELFFTKCVPLDIDHLVFKLKISPIDLPKLWDYLNRFGKTLYLTGREFTSEGKAYVSLIDFRFLNKESFMIPQEFREEGVIKIRFYINKDGIVSCVPMTFYAIADGTVCSLAIKNNNERWPVKFCDLNPSFRNNTEVCQECGNFNISLQLGAKFLREFLMSAKDNNINVKFLRFNERIIRSCYFTIGEAMVRAINESLKSVAKRYENELQRNGKPEKSIT